MSEITVDEVPPSRAAESQWAVDTHGLTKRFGQNVAVNGVELATVNPVEMVRRTYRIDPLTPSAEPSNCTSLTEGRRSTNY